MNNYSHLLIEDQILLHYCVTLFLTFKFQLFNICKYIIKIIMLLNIFINILFFLNNNAVHT